MKASDYSLPALQRKASASRIRICGDGIGGRKVIPCSDAHPHSENIATLHDGQYFLLAKKDGEFDPQEGFLLVAKMPLKSCLKSNTEQSVSLGPTASEPWSNWTTRRR